VFPLTGDDDLSRAYAAEAEGPGVRARAIRLYLQDRSACEIAAVIGRTTTPSSITGHLRDAGLGGVHWCPVHRVHEEI